MTKTAPGTRADGHGSLDEAPWELARRPKADGRSPKAVSEAVYA
ncbi:hypothetical protein LuPra_03380 [Luteitalea pratensis]|uniref:Uncharacterized protein n=1 Tax=Luteitalea pratensis TaxID=1855912 RepID=A0A143PNY2_LUTPR|nr:hypothetical protein [Luteitalea pratensis]AMY10151.1 hypothetical protein LuPra_03380 [Luteitalea pratensis]